MRRNVLWLLAPLIGLLSASPPARGDDSDIFFKAPVQPNVVIMIDTSGSMDDKVGGVKKITTAKSVVTNLINSVSGVRFGIFRFNDDGDDGQIVAEIGTSKTDMIAAISVLVANGSTPLGHTEQMIQQYYKGLLTHDVITEYECGTKKKPKTCRTTTAVNYPSPIQYECQKNYVILVTDGMPTGEPVALVSSMATSLNSADHASSITGKQNVIVNTVGFDVPEGKDLLQTVATNGGGKFYLATTIADLENALTALVSGIVTENYSFSMPVVPSVQADGGDKAYFASFQPAAAGPFWNGYLKAYTRDSAGHVPMDGNGQPLTTALAWDAAQLLATRTSASRTIYTTVSGSLQSFTKTNGLITSTLLTVASSAAKDTVVDFIRGVDTNDADGDSNITEDRATKLGDIFHSTPMLVYPPPLSGDSSYQTFKTTNAHRTTILLAGANDGMLHAFQASDGYEMWAFIPNDLLDNLKDLTTKTGTHPYFVDSSPVVADVKLSGTWKTVAIFGERRGGGSYHALDVTNTASPTYLWSFTDTEIAESWSEPVIAKIKMSGGTEKYVAFVGGGYNTTSNNAKGRTVLAIDLATGTKIWQYKYVASGDAAYMNFSIPASPRVADLDADGYADRIYIGDVGGQLWKFDVSPQGTLSSGLINNWSGKRMFVALPSQTNPPASGVYHAPQAIYGTPALAYDVTNALWVYFGTGDRNNPNDTSGNRFYGIKDNVGMTNGAPLQESNLLAATSNAAVTQGWYLTLPANEKVLSSGTVFNAVVYFTSYLTVPADVCDNPQGTGWLYAVSMLNGHAAIDWDNHAVLTDADGSTNRKKEIGAGIPSKPAIMLGPTTDGVVVSTTDEGVTDEAIPRERRKDVLYWREVL